MKLQWLTIPPSDSITQSFSSLAIHSIIDDGGRLTSLGSKVAEIPLDVKAACLLDSHKFRCGEEILTVVAMTAVQDVFIIPSGAAGAVAELERRKFTAEEGSWQIIVVVQVACAVFPSAITRRFNSRSIEEVLATLQHSDRKLSRGRQAP
ncbi:hypothetical protein EI94DRAFT_37379 [Lactarius quietus]|nr:hypothetical protein EI94DRAFT_37379 [Lactarius quietus]